MYNKMVILGYGWEEGVTAYDYEGDGSFLKFNCEDYIIW